MITYSCLGERYRRTLQWFLSIQVPVLQAQRTEDQTWSRKQSMDALSTAFSLSQAENHWIKKLRHIGNLSVTCHSQTVHQVPT